MYHSITFGNKNTWDDWHLIPTSRPVINPPGLNANMVEIPGMDGSYDMTEWLAGRPIYKDRSGSLEFAVANDYTSWEVAYSEISNYLHGQKMRVVLEDDPGFYYEGRMTVNKWKSDKWYSIITINYVLAPWKKAIISTSEPWLWDPFNFRTGVIQNYSSYTVSGSATINVVGMRQPIAPTIISSAAMVVTFKGQNYNLVAGRNYFPTMIFDEGNNSLTFTGTGTITIDYTGGSL